MMNSGFRKHVFIQQSELVEGKAWIIYFIKLILIEIYLLSETRTSVLISNNKVF